MSKLYYHTWDSKEDFFKRIDENGGWEVNKKYINVDHGVGKCKCEFSNEYIRSNWCTSRYSSDDYFLWKLSESAKDKLRLEGLELARTNLTTLYLNLNK